MALWHSLTLLYSFESRESVITGESYTLAFLDISVAVFQLVQDSLKVHDFSIFANGTYSEFIESRAVNAV